MDAREEIAKYGKLLHDTGLVIGAGGNISVRDGEKLIIKKRETSMSAGDPDDYAVIGLAEARKGASAYMLSSETPFHLACYAAGPEINALVHVHSPYMTAAAKKTDVLEDISYEFECVLQNPVPVIGFLKPGSAALGEALAEKVRNGATAVLMRKHGAVSVGKDLKEAYLRIQALERACICFLHG
jgi:L-fuculose-phosphate aldolase